jgi:magnesium transporter
MRAVMLRGGELVETTSCDDVRAARGEGHLVWVILEHDRPDVGELLVEHFGLHPLTVEDLWNNRELPKVEEFPGYLQLLAHGVREAAPGTTRLETTELDVIVGAGFVISHTSDDALTGRVLRQSKLHGTDFERGPAWIAHALLDALVETFLPIIDDYDVIIEKLEREVIEKAGTPAGKPVLTRIFRMKRDLLALRRVALYQREIFLRLSRGEFRHVPAETVPFFRDVYDHFSRVTSLAESYRELLSSVLESYLSVQSNRMNEVMKALTLISTVMLPLTFIAGVYGMNFDVMPELKWRFGYLWALGLMAAVTLGILVWFRHKRWL